MWQGIIIYFDTKNSVHWPKAEATVLATKIKESRGKFGVTYCPEWDYYFSVDGKQYNSTRAVFESCKCHSYRKNAELELNKHPIGSKVFAIYDPENPSKAALRLSNDSPFNMLLILFCMLIVFEIIVLIVILKRINIKHTKPR